MRTIVALLFISAALSASATNPALQFIEGLAAGLNNSALVGDVQAIDYAAEDIKTDFEAVIAALRAHALENATSALEVVVQDVYNLIVDTHDIVVDTHDIVDDFVKHAENLTKEGLINNFLLNYNQTKLDVLNFRAAAASEDYYTIGLISADLLKIGVLGRPDIPLNRSRPARQLSELTGSIVVDGLDAVLLVQGFLETANTTVDPNEYQLFVNDATYAAVLLQPVVNDIKARNFSAAITDGEAAINQLKAVRGDLAVLKGQLAQWIARDLPLLEDHNRVVTAIQAVFGSQATNQNIQKVEAAYKNGDFEGTGEAIGNLYNEFYAFLSQ